MARIAISLCGEGRGHAARVCTLVERLGGGQEFLIAAATEGLEFLRARFATRGNVRLVELPGLRFRYVGGRLDVPGTIVESLWFAARELPRQVAGLTSAVEAFHLGKPLLVLPERAHAEQTMNAHFLAAEDCGAFAPLEAVTAETIRGFLDGADRFVAGLAERRGRMDGLPAAARAIAAAVGCEPFREMEEVAAAA